MSGTDWDKFSAELQDWREHPVTETLRKAVRQRMAARKQSLLSNYWQGQAEPESVRQALGMVEEWFEDFFESDAEEIRAVIENDE